MVVNVVEDIKPVSYIKSNASDVMDYVYENKKTLSLFCCLYVNFLYIL